MIFQAALRPHVLFFGAFAAGGGQKVELPENWNELCEKYPGNLPTYLDY